MLFLGNSYTLQNDLPVHVAEVFAAAGETVVAVPLATPGWRFVDHVTAIETADTPHAAAFASAADWVFLQEQSQIPGFPEGEAELEGSLEAAVALDGYAATTGARTMFLMTWGRRDGDPDNAALYPDFPTMQARLADGYLAYAEAASQDGTTAWVAPAGLAWQRIYDDVVAAGEDPLEIGGAFAGLYSEDGSHPSPRGTYLAACVLYASTTGLSPEGLAAPDDVLDPEYLQEVAAAVVLEGELSYPWSEEEDPDTGDTGSDDSGATGATDSGETVDDAGAGGDPETDDAGCGCATGGSALVPFAGLLLLGRRRRVASRGAVSS